MSVPVRCLVVFGDTQRTSPLELWRESNDAERARIWQGIADAKPDLVLSTGDLVFDGASSRQWAELDELSTPLRDANIPMVTAFGNHEYWLGRRAAASTEVFDRFPLVDHRRWYEVPFGPLRIVVLDSNQRVLTEAEWREQHAWYEAALTRAAEDPSVRGVFVAVHHPPYTNSTVTGDETHVQRWFVDAFSRCPKTLAMLSGHVHSYERFERGGKVYVVSGGGGGPRARLAMGDARRHRDDVFDGPAIRDFHFTVYTVCDDGVDAEVRGLAKGGAEFREMDRFRMGW